MNEWMEKTYWAWNFALKPKSLFNPSVTSSWPDVACIPHGKQHLFSSDANMRHKSLYFPYSSRGRPRKQYQAKISPKYQNIIRIITVTHSICCTFLWIPGRNVRTLLCILITWFQYGNIGIVASTRLTQCQRGNLNEYEQDIRITVV